MNILPWSATVQEVGIIPITICSLLSEVTIGEKLKNVKKIIISSHTSSFELRENMNKKGFKIIDEAVVFDKGKYYEIIVYSNGYEKLSKLDMKYGPIISKRKDEITKAYFNERYLKLIEIYKKIPNGNKKLKDDLNKKIKEIKKFL